MARMVLDFDLKDIARFKLSLAKVGEMPPRAAAKAAGKARTVIRRTIKSYVPVDTGTLKRGIISKGERSRIKGKKVYDLMFDPAMNDIFQRPVKHPGAAGSGSTKGGYAYYPASMEYGFITRSKGGGYPYIPGYHFMREGTEDSAAEARSAAIRAAVELLEKEWKK